MIQEGKTTVVEKAHKNSTAGNSLSVLCWRVSGAVKNIEISNNEDIFILEAEVWLTLRRTPRGREDFPVNDVKAKGSIVIR